MTRIIIVDDHKLMRTMLSAAFQSDACGIYVAYKERIFNKLGINNTMEMVQYALKNNVIKID